MKLKHAWNSTEGKAARKEASITIFGKGSCGHRVEVTLTAEDVSPKTGVPCTVCDATYTVKWRKLELQGSGHVTLGWPDDAFQPVRENAD